MFLGGSGGFMKFYSANFEDGLIFTGKDRSRWGGANASTSQLVIK